MTLILGIKCKDGIVVASDGAATLGSMGQGTALQPTKKLAVIDDKIVVGVSGPVGLGQKIRGEVESIWSARSLSGKKPHEAADILSDGLRKYILKELKVAQEARNCIGNAALSSALSSTIIVLPVSGELCMFQFDQQGASEESTFELPFASIGSGQSIADPFLGFIRRIFWPDDIPNLNEGIFAAVWTLDHAIKINSGGIAEPIQVITLSKNKGDVVLKEYTKDELREHQDAIKEAESKLYSFREAIQNGRNAKEIPTPE